MPTVEQLLRRDRELAAVSDTPRLDLELLLGHAMGKSRSYLYAWPDTEPEAPALLQFEQWFLRRRNGEPVAYLIGQREFWTFTLVVTPAVLIPRPDTEILVEAALECISPVAPVAVLDLGTGSGAIALALARERPQAQVTAVDRSPEALAVAQGNALALGLQRVEWLASNWFSGLGSREFDVIASNPPYVAADDVHLTQGDVKCEPRSALVAAEGGLADLRAIAMQARGHLRRGGWLLLEHGASQAAAVTGCLAGLGYENIQVLPDLGGRDRVTRARWGAGHAQ